MVEGSLAVKLPTTWTDGKAEVGRVREERRSVKIREDQRRSDKRKSEKKEDAGARKGRKVGIHCIFPMICGSRGLKSGQVRDEQLARSCGAKHMSKFGALLEVELSKKCTLLWRASHFQVKVHKAHHSQTTFGS